MSYKVSVESVADAGGDDILVALIDVVFRKTTFASWAVFSGAMFVPVCLSFIFWLNDHFLGAALFSAAAALLALGRLLGLPREKSVVQTEGPEELQAQV